MKPTTALRWTFWFGIFFLTFFSLVSSFFVVFNMIFTDIFGLVQRIESYAYAGVVYLVLGFIAGLIGPAHPRVWAWVLSVPAVAVLVLYTFSEPQNFLIHLGFAILVPLSSYVGARLGSRLRLRKKAQPMDSAKQAR